MERDPRWTLEELGRRVAEALSVDYPGPRNGQVSAVPNPRTIRYYTTLGLIDRPAEMRGRTALYGRRHLCQLVAIKRLQAEGYALAEIQRRLAGAGDRQLAALARLPQPASRAPRPRPRRTEFWRARPEARQEKEEAAQEGERSEGVGGSLDLVARLELAPGVTLLLPPSRSFTERDAAELRRAAAPLLEELERRGLVRPPR